MSWQGIESAPRDGTAFLGFWQYVYPGDKARTCGMRVIEWDEVRGGWSDDEGETHVHGAREDQGLFTHWHPLPDEPT